MPKPKKPAPVQSGWTKPCGQFWREGHGIVVCSLPPGHTGRCAASPTSARPPDPHDREAHEYRPGDEDGGDEEPSVDEELE